MREGVARRKALPFLLCAHPLPDAPRLTARHEAALYDAGPRFWRLIRFRG
jgi:hypothetical protein